MPGYTRIEDLPELENQLIDAVGQNNNDEYRHRDTNKFIRGNNRMIPNGAGMGRDGTPGPYGPPHGAPQRVMQPPPQEMIEQPVMEVREMRYSPMQGLERPDPMSLNCVDIAMHIQQCPICSKFYNGDKSLYVIVIVILSIICLLLMKRVLNI
jgi:hypothetical protein